MMYKITLLLRDPRRFSRIAGRVLQSCNEMIHTARRRRTLAETVNACRAPGASRAVCVCIIFIWTLTREAYGRPSSVSLCEQPVRILRCGVNLVPDLHAKPICLSYTAVLCNKDTDIIVNDGLTCTQVGDSRPLGAVASSTSKLWLQPSCGLQ
ncbi:hypothetical protein B0H14DRAFT_2680362 [Mycena olivaceomarginata]|nr:hypothetical protein B0H14DRAFT_2680362 [Mycena olivaceomarginata]